MASTPNRPNQDDPQGLAKRLAAVEEQLKLIRVPDGLDAVQVVYTTNGTADTEDSVAHTLGRVPAGFLVLKADKPGVFYQGTTPWTSGKIFLSCTVASVRATLLVF